MCVSVCEARVIPVYNDSSDLLSAVMEETGGLGVDVVVDSGGKKTRHSFRLSCAHVSVAFPAERRRHDEN